jgi:hypothetical protein
MKCNCGSGQERYEILDGYGIFLTYVCYACENERLQEFRPDILQAYDTDEPID